jgi:hypothetical protein
MIGLYYLREGYRYADTTKTSTVEINVVTPQDKGMRTMMYSVLGTNSYSILATGDSDRAGEILTGASSLVGKSINEVTITLRKSGAPTSTISLLVRSGQDNSSAFRFGSIDAAELTTSD